MLIQVRKSVVPTVDSLHALAMRKIFDRASFSEADYRVLEEGIDAWSHKVNLSEDERTELKRVVNALIADERGYFNRAKFLMQRDNIHYKNFFKAGLPYVKVEGRTSWNKA